MNDGSNRGESGSSESESAAQLREAQRIAGIGSWQWVVGSDTITWSEGLHLILGRDVARGPPSFRDLHQVYTPESWERLGVVIERALRAGEPYEVEVEMIRSDGSTCLTTTRGEAVRGSDNAVVMLRGTVHDISQRKRAELAYTERAAQLREAQRIAGIGSWEWVAQSDTIAWSEGLHLILGRDVALGPPSFRDLHQFYTPESWQRLGVVIERALTAGEPYEVEVEMIRRDGTTCWTTTRGEAVRAPDGRVTMLRGTVHDISQRKRAELAYLERAAQLREAQRIAGIGSWEWVPGSDVITWSEGLHLILGRDVGLGPPSFSTLHQFYTPDSWQRLGVVIERALRAGEPYEVEVEMIRSDGTTCWTTTRGEAVRGSDGIVTQLRGTVHDISQRKRAELAQEDRLRSIGLLAAGIAHEINNPLTYVLSNIKGLAEELEQSLAAEKALASGQRTEVADSWAKAGFESNTALEGALERAKDALDGALRIKSIAGKLKTFSRVDDSDMCRIDLKQPIEAAINMAQNEIKFRAVLVRDYGDLPLVWASEGKLAQVFLNLLINSTHAIEEGQVDRNRITVRTWRQDDAVFAQVADSGGGISPQNLPRVFDPFFTTKGVGQGSGLGLAICRNIVAECGGTISVESQLGSGTRFTIRLPVRAEEARPVVPRDTAADSRPAPSVRGRVLIVDDEPLIRATMTRLLKRDHAVVAVPSGNDGKALLERDQAFDLILCDLMMPGMTGMDLHRWLVDRDPSLASRMVFITGGAFTPKASEYLAGTGNQRIEKPFDSKELGALVAKLVRAAKTASLRGARGASGDAETENPIGHSLMTG